MTHAQMEGGIERMRQSHKEGKGRWTRNCWHWELWCSEGEGCCLLVPPRGTHAAWVTLCFLKTPKTLSSSSSNTHRTNHVLWFLVLWFLEPPLMLRFQEPQNYLWHSVCTCMYVLYVQLWGSLVANIGSPLLSKWSDASGDIIMFLQIYFHLKRYMNWAWTWASTIQLD